MIVSAKKKFPVTRADRALIEVECWFFSQLGLRRIVCTDYPDTL